MGFFDKLVSDTVSELKRNAKDALNAFITPDYLRDYTHASKTFTTNMYAHAPKYKFLFHVYFEISPLVQSASNSAPTNYGLMVKSVELPSFAFSTHELNQYNRKRITQSKVNYNPVKIAFHDDNANEINKLWHAYYSYYYKDPLQLVKVATQSANSQAGRDTYTDANAGSHDWGYIGDTTSRAFSAVSKPPFFSKIKIYGFHQHSFIEYTLINPVIENFAHDTYNYAEANGVMEATMTLKYETVTYSNGALNGKDPGATVARFGESETYDQTLSPIARPGANATILGQGGLVDATGSVVSDLSSGNYLRALQTVGTTAKTFINPSKTKSAFSADAKTTVLNTVSSTPNRSGSFSFPTPDLSSVKKSIAKIL